MIEEPGDADVLNDCVAKEVTCRAVSPCLRALILPCFAEDGLPSAISDGTNR